MEKDSLQTKKDKDAYVRKCLAEHDMSHLDAVQVLASAYFILYEIVNIDGDFEKALNLSAMDKYFSKEVLHILELAHTMSVVLMEK